MDKSPLPSCGSIHDGHSDAVLRNYTELSDRAIIDWAVSLTWIIVAMCPSINVTALRPIMILKLDACQKKSGLYRLSEDRRHLIDFCHL